MHSSSELSRCFEGAVQQEATMPSDLHVDLDVVDAMLDRAPAGGANAGTRLAISLFDNARHLASSC